MADRMIHRRLATAFAACLFIAAASTVSAQGKVNLLANAGFESGDSVRKLPGWSCKLHGGAQAAFDSAVARDGRRSLRIEVVDAEDMVLLQSARVPVQPGMTYEFSCWVRNHGGRVWFRQNLHDLNGRMIRERFKRIFVSNERHGWKQYKVKIKVMPGERSLSITAFFSGKPGMLWLDHMRINRVARKPGKEILFRLVPGYYMDDNVFHLPLGSPQILMLAVSNESQYQAKTPRILVDLPQGIEMLGTLYDASEHAPTRVVRVAGQACNRYDYTMGLTKSSLRSVDFSRTSYGAIQLVLRATDSRLNGKVLEARIRFADTDMECEPCPFKLIVTPPVSPARTPKRFRTGADVVAGLDFYDPALTPWADFYKQCGFNEIYVPRVLQAGSTHPKFKSRDPTPINLAMKQRGISVIMVCDQLNNGYQVRYTGLESRVPDSVRIRRADNMIIPNTFDPAYIRRQGEWYVRSVHAVLDSMVEKHADHLWCNWEPYRYTAEKGSFTALSMQDFARFANIPLETVSALGPHGILRKHRKMLLRFQNWQYVQAMKVLHKIVRDYGKKLNRKINLILCTGPDLLAEKGGSDYFACFGGPALLDAFAAPSSWKYVAFDCRYLKDRKKKRLIELGMRQDSDRGEVTWKPMSHRSTLDAVERITGFIRRVTARNRLPGKPYIHLPQTRQCGSWVVWPRAVELQMLAAFIGGADGVMLYFFPQGFDGRYWRSVVAANDQIALYEDYVLGGTKLEKGFALTARTARLQHKDYAGNLTWRAFKLNNRILLALCNFDYVDPAVFDLSCTATEPGMFACHDPWRKEYLCYEPGQGLSARNLKKLTLELPPMSIRFFVIEPWQQGYDYGKPLLLSVIKENAEHKIQSLNHGFAKALVEIRELLRPEEDEGAGSTIPIPELRGDGFTAKVVLRNNRKLYQMSTGDQEVLIDYSRGAVVRSWKAGGAEQVADKCAFCKDRLYFPAEHMNAGDFARTYCFVSHGIDMGALTVVFERTLRSAELKGLILRKSYTLGGKQNRLRVAWSFRNNGRSDRTIGFWSKNVPALMSKCEDQVLPVLSLGNVKYDSMGTRIRIFRIKGVEIAEGYARCIEHFLDPNTGRKVESATSAIAVIHSGSRMLRVVPATGTVSHVYVWGTQSSRVATLELAFAPARIKPGTRWNAWVEYTAK